MRHSRFVVAPLAVEILRLPIWDSPPLSLSDGQGATLARAMQCAFVKAAESGAGGAEAAGAKTSESANEYEVSLMLSDDAHIKKLNHEWRDKNQATNVLAFPSGFSGTGGDGAEIAETAGQPPLLGDVVVAHETLLTEAQAQGKKPFDHLLHLCVHGLLHLLGYDHVADKDAAAMSAVEKNVLGAFNIAYDMQKEGGL